MDTEQETHGACGNGYREADLTIEVVDILYNILKNYANVDVYDQNSNAFEDLKTGNVKANFSNYDYVFEVHFNSASEGAKGTEIFVTRSEEGTIVEEKIMEKLRRFFTVRGVKRMNFNVIKRAKDKGASSALIEVCFISNAEDVSTYQNNKNEICQEIANGIIEGFGLTEGQVPNNTDNTNSQERIDEDMKIWKNGSTPEKVFQCSNMTKEIGALAPNEQCQAIKINGSCFMVYYKVDGTDYEKCGFVSYNGGI